MNINSLITQFKTFLNVRGFFFLLLFLCMHLEGNAQSFAPTQDTITVILPANADKTVVTGLQLHTILNPTPTGLLFYANINSQDSTLRDTNRIDNSAIQNVFYVGCDTTTYIGDNTSYGIESTMLDTFANFSIITFFAVGDTSITGSPLTGTGASVTSVIKIIDQSPPIFDAPAADTVLNCLADTSAYSMNLFPLNVTDACSGVSDTILVQTIESVTGDTCLKLTRTWTFIDGVGNSSIPFIQKITVIDTIGAFWDTMAIKNLIANNAVIANDSVDFPTDSTLVVLLDTSTIAGRNSYHFWSDTMQFKPIAVDSCLGVGTLIGMDSVFVVDLNTFNLSCRDSFITVFQAVDAKGNFTGSGAGVGYNVGDFVFSLVVKDTTPPVIIDVPLVHLSPMITSGTGINPDTFLFFVEKDTCGIQIDSADIRIVVRDSISKDIVSYKWRVDSFPTSTTIAQSTSYPAFAIDENAADRFYYTGKYKISYIFKDSCDNKDSLTFILDVRTIPPIVVQHPDTTKFDGFVGTGNGNGDTYILYNDPDTCGVLTTGMDLMIVAKDTFDLDGIEYSWKIKPILSSPNPTGMPNDSLISNDLNPKMNVGDSLNSIALFFPVGAYEVTFNFQDTSACPNLDSISYILRVQDTSGTDIINYPVNVAPFFTNNTLVVAPTSTDCSESITYLEPNYLNFSSCFGSSPMAAGFTIVRKTIKGGTNDIFDGKPIVNPMAMTPIQRRIVVSLPVDTTIIRYIFRDTFGSMDSIDITFIVPDNIDPVAVCPAGTPTLTRNASTCLATLPDYTMDSRDDCSLALVKQSPPAGYMLMRDTMVTIIAIDGSGNTDTCRFMVTVATLPPLPVAAALPDRVTQCGHITIVAPSATLNCGTIVYGVPSGLIGIPLGTIIPSYSFISTFNATYNLVWLFAGDGGLNTTQIQKVTFSPDITPPVIVLPANQDVFLDSLGMVVFTATNLNVSYGDNCSPPDSIKITTDSIGASCDSLGKTFLVTVTAEDEAGNKGFASLNVTIKDNRPPDFIGVPRDTILTCDAATPTLPNIQIRDNCTFPVSIVTIDTINTRVADNRNSGYYNYDITYKWTATDASNNTASDSVVYAIRDTLAPTLPYANPLLVNSSPGATDCSASVTLNFLADIQDNCSDTVTFKVDFGDGIFRDTTYATLNINVRDTIIIKAKDIAGNESLDTLVILVNDKTVPRPVCVNAISITINPLGYVVVDSADINMNSTDNCTAPSDLLIKLNRDTFTCEDVGKTFTVTMTVTDEAGNFAGCSSQVTIQDFTGAGSFSCPPTVNIPCGSSIDPSVLGFPTVVDVCGQNTLTFADDTVATIGSNCITIARTWTARDELGNPTNCVQMINLIDVIAPVLTASYSDVTVTCIGNASTSDSIIVTDNCATTYFAVAKDTAYCTATDTLLYTRIWTGTDGCNVVTNTQVIKIFDNVAPVISAQDTFTYNTGEAIPDSCGVFVTIDFAAFVTDCNEQFGLSIRHSDPGNDTSAILSRYYVVGSHTVIITAKDSCGNIATKNVVIDVNDTSIPTVVCVENLVLSLGTGGTGVLNVSDVFSSATDNCNGNLSMSSATLSKTIFDCSDLGIQQVLLTVTDGAGNIGTCTVNIEVTNGGNIDVINVAIAKKDETISGAKDGKAWVTVTGGSGNYTYLWDDVNASTSDTISNLSAGLYTVIVIDPVTNCRLTDTVRVNPGTIVNYTAVDVTGLAGSVVQVPIKVTNFTNVASLEMIFNIANSTVAQFMSGNKAGGFNLPIVDASSFTFLSSSSMLFSESISPSTGETKPDGTVIFYLNVILGSSGTTTISITGNGSAIIETSAIINGSAQIVAASGTGAAITIGVVNPTFGGTVKLVSGTPLENVTVNLTGTNIGTDETDSVGVYSFPVTLGQIATVRPYENDNISNQLSVSDLVDIQKHILRQDTLDSPYKILAADVNATKTITISDLVEIQAVILGQSTSFSGSNSWRFIPADHVLDPTNPWANPIPDSISVISANADFIALKMGDVNLTATMLSLTTGTGAVSRDVFRFGIDDQTLEEGQIIEVPFKANNFTAMLGYQMTINAAAEWLTFEGVTAGALENIANSNFGLTKAEEGLISTIWYQSVPLSIEQNTTLFTLTFRVNQSGKNLSEILSLSSDMLHAEAHSANREEKNVSLVFDKNTVLAGFELFQNKPNPFNAQTTIGFSLPKTAPATLRFFDFSGRMVYQIKGAYAKGYNEVTVNKNSLSGTGVLYYEIETPTNTARKKMIVLE